jgi:hypothetical protein
MTVSTLELKPGQIITVDGWKGTSLITAIPSDDDVEVNPGYYDWLPITQITGIVRTLTARELPEGAAVYAGDVTWLKDVPQPGRLAWTSATGEQCTDDDMDALLANGAEIYRVDWDSGVL